MKSVRIASLVLTTLLTVSLSAAVLEVPGQYASIQEAIDASNHGDTVRVSPGMYFERINFNGKNITVTSVDPNNWGTVGYTIINAEGEGSVVTFNHGETSEAVLTGFTLTGGIGTLESSGSSYNYYYGGGILCEYGSPTITRNVIANNTMPYNREETIIDLGDVIYITYTYDYSYGGGIYCSGAATITDNLIYRNTAFRGGGIYAYAATIKNNIIYDNSAIYGGGVYLSSSRQLINNTIAGNDASLDTEYSSLGGNVYASFNTDPTRLVVANNIICNAASGSGIYPYGATEDAIRFNNVWGNSPGNYMMQDPRTGDYIYDGDADWTGRHGNISADPVFSTDWGRHYRLDVESPCVSAGDPAYVPAEGETDIDGEPRVYAVRLDIGADELVGYVKPLALAGPDQHVLTPQAVTLDGTTSYFSDPSGATYQWSQTSGPSAAVGDPLAGQLVFTPSAEGWYTFELTVGDGQYSSEPDEVLVVVGNEQPIASAGADKLWPAPGYVGLDATNSYDADPPDQLTYAWMQTEGPAVVLDDANSATPRFHCDEPGIYRFEVVVNDGFVDSEPNVVKIETAPFTSHVETAIVAEDSMTECYYADVSGTMVAYAAMDYSVGDDLDVYCTDSRTNQTVTFNKGRTDTHPSIDGGTVVWASGSDYYYYEMCTDLNVGQLATGESTRLLYHQSDVSYGYPAISGNKIAYLRHYDVFLNDMSLYDASPYDICVADISNLSDPVYFTIAAAAGHGAPYPSDNYYYAYEDYVDISGDIVVWEGDGDIYGADLSDLNDIKVFPICTAPERQSDPAVSGNLVVWKDERYDAGDIYGADISDREHVREFEVYSARGEQLYPDVDETLIVFVDGSDSGGTLRTYGYSPQYGPFACSLLSSEYGAGPKIDGGNIAWARSSYRVYNASVDFGYAAIDGPIQNATTGQTYDRIQYAIAAAVDGDVILVPEGTYSEKLSISGKNITLTSTDPADPAVRAATVLAGDGPRILFTDGVGQECLFTGFTVASGSFGIYCNGSSPTIRLCDVVGNRDAGVKLWGGSDPTIDRCNITNNGIGVEMWMVSSGRGVPHNLPILTNCLIADNRGRGVYGSKPTIDNCTIAYNLGLAVAAASPTLTNSIVYFNGTDDADATVTAVTRLTVLYSDIQGGAAGTGNIDVDPLFRGLRDYHLMSEGWAWDALQGEWTWDDATSPCIDAGDPDASLGQEILCEPGGGFSERAANNRLNMGVYGGTAEASLAPR